MLPCCIEHPFCATQAVHLENRIVLVGTIQAQIFGHYGRGDPAKLRGEMIGHRFAAAMSRCPDQHDKRWREQSLRGKLTFQSVRATRRATARTGWLVDIAYSCARTWRLQGVHTRVRETFKVVLARRLACDRGGIG